MKKIYLAALTLAMTACVSNEDLNPVDNYGYIDVNVSNDPVIQTRTTVADLTGWTITATNTTDETKIYDLTESKVVPAGTYKIEVSSHSSMKEANVAEDLGAPYYTCTTSAAGEGIDGVTKNQNVTVSAGSTATADIYCGRAKNARIKLVDQLNTGLTSTLFSEVKLITSDIGNRYSVTLYDQQVAYFTPEVTVPYTISYKYGNEDKTLENLNIKIGGAATESVITLKSNSSGQITVSIYIDDEFGEGTEQEITFDAATGTEVITEQTN